MADQPSTINPTKILRSWNKIDINNAVNQIFQSQFIWDNEENNILAIMDRAF